MATLAEIREKLKQAESRGSDTQTRPAMDNSIYPFWNILEGKESVIRFLPDGDINNTFFWVERAMIKLPFAGIKGETESRPVTVQVPCVEMYNDGAVCPVLSEVRGWFKLPGMEELGRKYWKKRSYIFQGYVVEDGLNEATTPDNPIRRFIIGPQIYNLIRSALVDPELDDLPTDFINGLDFRLKKGSKGGFADYATSTWSRKTRPLTSAEQQALQSYGLYNLSDFLPKKPTDVELKIIKEMFEASVDGEAYDPERWGQYYKPAGLNQQTGDPLKQGGRSSAPSEEDEYFEAAPVAVQQPIQQPVQAAPASPATTASDNKAQDILAMIRNRQNAQ